ncbi:unnamed protein product, partial [Heterotrigona itama]
RRRRRKDGCRKGIFQERDEVYKACYTLAGKGRRMKKKKKKKNKILGERAEMLVHASPCQTPHLQQTDIATHIELPGEFLECRGNPTAAGAIYSSHTPTAPRGRYHAAFQLCPASQARCACETPACRMHDPLPQLAAAAARQRPRDRITSLSVLTAKTRNWGT